MPSDGTNYKKIKPLETGLAGLKQLGDALRYSVPATFRWNFRTIGSANDCGSYGGAVRLAHDLWPEQLVSRTSRGLADALFLPTDDLDPIFGIKNTASVYGLRLHDNITPTDVADAIDRYIERREAQGKAQ